MSNPGHLNTNTNKILYLRTNLFFFWTEGPVRLVINQIHARFFAICIRHGGKLAPLTREVIFISSAPVRAAWCGMSNRNRPLLSRMSSSPSVNHKLEAADLKENPLGWNALFFFFACVATVAAFAAFLQLFLFFLVILTFRKPILICVYESWKGPHFPGKASGPATSLYPRRSCSYKM